MPCVSLDIPDIPIPDVFVTLPLVPPLPLPISGEFCCKFTVGDIIVIQATIAGINAAIGATGGVINAGIAMVEGEIIAIAQKVMVYKHLLSLNCPMNETVL